MSSILSCGLELELETVRASFKCNWRMTHDASTETIAPTQNGVDIMYGDRNLDRNTFGIELVSPIISEDEILKSVTEITSQAKSLGEPDISYRGSLHVHVGYGEHLKMIQNLMRLWLFSERLWFKLAGMGYQYRGYQNESVFCRPLRYSQVVNIGNEYVRSIDVDAALSATDIESLWRAFGLENPRGGVEKYHPARYSALNIYSIWLHNTIEFRVFNKSLRPRWITAVTKFCIAFSYLSMLPIEFNLPENTYPDSCGMDYLDILDSLFLMLKENNIPVDSNVRSTLAEIINKTPEPRSCSRDVLTHLASPRGMANMGSHTRVDSSNVRASGFLDIHNDGANYDLFERCG